MKIGSFRHQISVSLTLHDATHRTHRPQPSMKLTLKVYMTIARRQRYYIQVWSFRDDVCRIEIQKAMYCVQFTEYVIIKLIFTHTNRINTPRPHHQSMIETRSELQCDYNSMKTKVLFKFGASEMMYVESRSKKLCINCVQFIEHVKIN